MSFDLSNLEEMKKYADFGQAILEMAKESGLIPKRERRKIVVKERTKIVIRRPRRTKAEIAASTPAPIDAA